MNGKDFSIELDQPDPSFLTECSPSINDSNVDRTTRRLCFACKGPVERNDRFFGLGEQGSLNSLQGHFSWYHDQEDGDDEDCQDRNCLDESNLPNAARVRAFVLGMVQIVVGGSGKGSRNVQADLLSGSPNGSWEDNGLAQFQGEDTSPPAFGSRHTDHGVSPDHMDTVEHDSNEDREQRSDDGRRPRGDEAECKIVQCMIDDGDVKASERRKRSSNLAKMPNGCS